MRFTSSGVEHSVRNSRREIPTRGSAGLISSVGVASMERTGADNGSGPVRRKRVSSFSSFVYKYIYIYVYTYTLRP